MQWRKGEAFRIQCLDLIPTRFQKIICSLQLIWIVIKERHIWSTGAHIRPMEHWIKNKFSAMLNSWPWQISVKLLVNNNSISFRIPLSKEQKKIFPTRIKTYQPQFSGSCKTWSTKLKLFSCNSSTLSSKYIKFYRRI